MAKCIKKGKEFRRASNDVAERLVKEEGWKYIDKNTYRRLKEGEES